MTYKITFLRRRGSRGKCERPNELRAVRLCCQSLESRRSGKSHVVPAVLVLISAIVPAFAMGDDKPDSKDTPVAVADVAAKTFGQARELIAVSNWAAAAEKLNLIITEYPKSKYYEPAIYWLAYVRKQQEDYQAAFILINRFISEFPQSTWKEDARSLRAELAGRLGNTQIINEELQNAGNDEVRLAALSGLLRVDPQKGLRQAEDILASGSKIDSRNFREGLINLIGKYGGTDAAAVLLKIAQAKSEQEVIRTAAIFALRRDISQSTLAQLTELVLSGDAPAVVEAALFVFLQQENQWAKELLVKIVLNSESEDTRRRTVHFLAMLKGGAAIDELIGLYDASKDIGVKREILATLSKTNNASAQARVLEISRVTEDMGIREEGILSLGKYGGEEIIEQMIRLYDVEIREDVKGLILVSLSASRQKNAFEKLSNVAQDEESLELRKKAAQLLRKRTTNPKSKED
jgi:HEAT repeat protein